MNKPLTPMTFTLPDGPSMGDPVYVDAQVRQMLDEARVALFEGEDPQTAIMALVPKWTEAFYAGNPQVAQTWSPESQAMFLRQRGLASQDNDPEAPVKSLVAETISRFIGTCVRLQEGKIDEEQAQFETDACVEDTAMLLRGLDNPSE